MKNHTDPLGKGNRGNADAEEDSEDEDEEEGPTLKKQFAAYVKARNPNDPGTYIVLSQSDNWMKNAGVIKGRTLTTTDTGICYFKFKKHKLNYGEYLEFLQLLAEYKKIPLTEITTKMINCGPPTQENTVNVGRPLLR